MTDEPVYYDPYDPGIVAEPYPVYARLREEAPLYYNEAHDFYAVSRFEDCSTGLNDWQSFPSYRGGILELIRSGITIPPGTLIFEDPPAHDIHRGLLSRVFTPRRISALEPQVRAYAASCLDPLVGSAGFDMIEALGAPMPMRVIGMLFGIPESEQEHVRDDPNRKLRTTAGKPVDYDGASFVSSGAIGEYVDWRAKNPSDDLMTDLLTAEFEDENGVVRTLTRDEVVTYATVVTGAGNETTGRLIGWLTKVLADNPDVRADLVADPSLVPNAVEETLRFEPPGPHIARYVAKDTIFHGQAVPEGSAILFLVASANRDYRRYPDPDRFDLRRSIGSQLTFGLGPHYCLGAALARLEGRVALEEILARFPRWDVDVLASSALSTSTVRGWAKLPIHLG
jgi:cytochrome P450